MNLKGTEVTSVTIARRESALATDEFLEKKRRIEERLARRRGRSLHAVWDGELRKHLGRIADRIDKTTATNVAMAKLGSLGDFDPDRLDLDSALSLSARLDELLVETADAAYVCSVLEAEFQRGDTTPITWRRLYGDDLPEALKHYREGDPVGEPALASARNRLSALSHTRYEDYLLLRTRQTMKSLFLLWLAPILLILVISFGWALWRVGELSLGDIILVGAAGALGAALSGAFKLRDTISHINDLRAFRPAIVVQPLLGTALALVLLLVLETGVLTIGEGTPDWAARALLGFVAGFSEPFSLKIVDRIAAIAESKTEKDIGGRHGSEAEVKADA